MRDEEFEVLAGRLSRARDAHLGRLSEVSTAAAALYEPARLATFSTAITAYRTNSAAELLSYGEEVRRAVIMFAEEFLLPLLPEIERRAVQVAETALGSAGYVERFDAYVAGLARKAERQGASSPSSRVQRSDTERALYEVGALNVLRRAFQTLQSDLQLVRLRSIRNATPSSLTPGLPMPFSKMMIDTIDILKTDGTKIEGRKASVQEDMIFMAHGDVLIEAGDLIVRRMSNGAQETYRVNNPGFKEKFHSIEAHYQMQVQHLGLPEARAAVQHIHIHGDNARVNTNSTDNSVNVVQHNGKAFAHIKALRAEIERVGLNAVQKAQALEIVDEVDGSFKGGKPKKTITAALLSSLPPLGNIASIAAAIIELIK